MEFLAAQSSSDASREQQPVDSALVRRQHLMRSASGQSHSLGGHDARAVAAERLQEFQGFCLSAVPQHAGSHKKTPLAPTRFIAWPGTCV